MRPSQEHAVEKEKVVVNWAGEDRGVTAAPLTGAFGVSELDQSLLEAEVTSVKYRNQSSNGQCECPPTTDH